MSGQRLPDEDYYEDNDVTEHVRQGDIFESIAFVHPEEAELGFVNPGMLITYTSGMMNQPPGSKGYKHLFRMIAPIVPLTMTEELRFSDEEIDRLRSEDPWTPYMYLPAHPPDFNESVVLPFRPILMMQNQLPRRVTQLKKPAAKQLQMKLFGTFLGGKPQDPDEALKPDMTDHWNDY